MFELQLGSGEELQRVVVQDACEAAPGFVASRRYVAQELASCGHRFLESNRRVVKLELRFLVLAHHRGGDPEQAQHPQVLGAEATWRGVNPDPSQPLLTRPPLYRARV